MKQPIKSDALRNDYLILSLAIYMHITIEHSHTQNTWNSNNSRSQRDSQQNISTRQTIVFSCENAFLILFSISFSLYLYLNVCMCTFARCERVYRILSQYREPKPWIDQQSQQYKPTRRYSSRGKHTTYGLHALHFACVYYLYCVSIVYICMHMHTGSTAKVYGNRFQNKNKKKTQQHTFTRSLSHSLCILHYTLIVFGV